MALLGWGDYLCEACRHFDTDGNDGNHPYCRKQGGMGWGEDPTVAIPLGRECPYGYESGVPSGYRGTLERREERARVIKAKMENRSKAEHTCRTVSEDADERKVSEYDAGFRCGIESTLQQLDGMIYERADIADIQKWIDSYWEGEQ